MFREMGIFLILLATSCLGLYGTEQASTQSATPSSTQPNKELVLDLGNKVMMKLVLIPAGEFLMGSPDIENDRLANEGPQHEVTISKPFYMGKYHVTRGEFSAFIQESGYKTDAEKEGWAYSVDGDKIVKVSGASWQKPGFEQTNDHPVVCVSHNDVVAFCDWLAKKSGRKVKLPTEAQWEYACRAGTKTANMWGDDPNDGKGWCNAADQTVKKQFPSWTVFRWDDGYIFTSPVGKFKSNGFGLYDMHGNAGQWCADWGDKNDYANFKSVDPQGPNTGTARVSRGGSWRDDSRFCRSAYRDFNWPSYRSSDLGFRILVDLK